MKQWNANIYMEIIFIVISIKILYGNYVQINQRCFKSIKEKINLIPPIIFTTKKSRIFLYHKTYAFLYLVSVLNWKILNKKMPYKHEIQI